MVKNLPDNEGDVGSVPGSGRSPGSRKWQPTPAFLPGKSHGQEEPSGLQSKGRKESDTTEHNIHS